MSSRLAIVALTFAACAAQAQQSVILVRHAELDDAPGVDAKRISISGTGELRAQRLAQLLAQANVAAVYATDFARTQETAAPAAKAAGHEVTVLSKGDANDFVARMRRDNAQQVVLVVGHTDTIPGIIKALGHPDDIKIDSKDYGNIFIVTPKSEGAPGFLRLRY
jgi:broad specificity phosphatase PhoE